MRRKLKVRAEAVGGFLCYLLCYLSRSIPIPRPSKKLSPVDVYAPGSLRNIVQTRCATWKLLLTVNRVTEFSHISFGDHGPTQVI